MLNRKLLADCVEIALPSVNARTVIVCVLLNNNQKLKDKKQNTNLMGVARQIVINYFAVLLAIQQNYIIQSN